MPQALARWRGRPGRAGRTEEQSGRTRPPAGLVVAPGERLLAWAAGAPQAPDRAAPDPAAAEPGGEAQGTAAVGGSRDAVYVLASPDGEVVRIAWEDVEAADWDAEAGRLRLSEVGRWGEERVVHDVALDQPDRLLQLVRERVTASIVLQRHVRLEGRRGLRVIARRAPRGGPLRWLYEYDEGVDPTDPTVRARAAEVLAVAREEAGEQRDPGAAARRADGSAT